MQKQRLQNAEDLTSNKNGQKDFKSPVRINQKNGKKEKYDCLNKIAEIVPDNTAWPLHQQNSDSQIDQKRQQSGHNWIIGPASELFPLHIQTDRYDQNQQQGWS